MFGMRPVISKRTDVFIAGALLGGGSIGLLAGTLICKLNGGIILNAPSLFRFVFIGGTVFLPLAVFGGILGEVHRETMGRGKNSINWSNARIALLVSSVVFLVVMFFIIPLTVGEISNANFLRTLPGDSVRKIEVYSSYPSHPDFMLMKVVDSSKALSDFVEAARDVRVEHPGSLAGGASEDWYIEVQLTDGDRMRLDWSRRSDYPTSVVGHFYKFNSDSTIYRGEFVSDTLRNWFDEHVLQTPR